MTAFVMRSALDDIGAGNDSQAFAREAYVMLLVFGVILVIGGAFFGIIAFNRHKNAQAASWPEVTGRIISSQVTHDTRTQTDSTGRETKTKVYEPRIRYSYDIGDMTYTCERVAYRNTHSPIKAKVQDIIDRYPAGAEVTVWYNPKNPLDAVLERSLPKGK